MVVRIVAIAVLIAVLATPAVPATAPAPPKVLMELTYPAGSSPKVFTTGWVFGARCVLDPYTKNAKNLASKVKWSGSGSFSPSIGNTSRPAFGAPGVNTIVLTIEIGRQKISKTFKVTAVSPTKYAAVGDFACCPADAHGCPACPHNVKGPIISGSPHVLVRGKPAARVGDTGTHSHCCGPNTFKIVSGDPQVLIDGKPAARKGDKTQHCGGMGFIGSAPKPEPAMPFGVFYGTVSGQTVGNLSLTLINTGVKGKFDVKDARDRTISMYGTMKGSTNPKTWKISGTLSGTASYKLFGKSRSEPIAGKFTGTATENAITGMYSAHTVEGDIRVSRQGSFHLAYNAKRTDSEIDQRLRDKVLEGRRQENLRRQAK